MDANKGQTSILDEFYNEKKLQRRTRELQGRYFRFLLYLSNKDRTTTDSTYVWGYIYSCKATVHGQGYLPITDTSSIQT